jgi:hypothetical protein
MPENMGTQEIKSDGLTGAERICQILAVLPKSQGL